jgi:hypothetical protein
MRSPAAFLAFCLKVKHALLAMTSLSDTLLAIVQQFCQKVDSYEVLYHSALDGSHTQIRERDKRQQELILLLDQMASLLESAFILDPDALYATGFTMAQDRRGNTRVKVPLESPNDFQVANLGERGRAVATASSQPEAYNHEIHINLKDPSVEEDWSHKSMFHDSSNMAMENLASGNICFRMRHHGQDGPGPWSRIVTATIT